MSRLFIFPIFFRKTVRIERHTGSNGHLGFKCKKKCTWWTGVGVYSGGGGRGEGNGKSRGTVLTLVQLAIMEREFSSLPQTVPRPLSRFDTHPRWQPVTQILR